MYVVIVKKCDKEGNIYCYYKYYKTLKGAQKGNNEHGTPTKYAFVESLIKLL